VSCSSRRRRHRAFFDFTREQLARDRPRFLAAGAEGFFGRGSEASPVSPEIVDWALGLALQASPRAMIEYVRTFSETDLRSDLASFTVPTLVVHGDADQSTPLEITGRPTARGIAGARLVVYEGAAHGLFFTEKDRLNRDLLEFVSS
jgi:non-heme chloroperoxidase